MSVLRGNGAQVHGLGRRLGALVALTTFSCVVATPLGANGAREIALYNIHTKKTLRIVYKRNGRYVPSALEKLNWHLRDWRSNEPTRMDPELIDLVWEIHAELGSRQPVHVISGYRSPSTNAMLRRTRGGQARRSQHMLGKAMDVRFPDIPVRRLRYSALLREQGGVGYYPTSATPFVHVDTGRVRHWPRMGRQELALLFPSGRTRHRPRKGGPITRGDAVAARKRNPVLAQRVAAFHQQRHSGPRTAPPSTRYAALSKPAPAPRLVRRPRLAERPPVPRRPVGELAPRPYRPQLAALGDWQTTALPRPPAPRPATRPPVARTDDAGPQPMPFRPTPQPAVASIAPAERSLLTQLASAIFGSGPRPEAPRRSVAPPNADEWISAPAFDEEHPEELYYRPFPIAPYITATASVDDVALQHMTHPDIDKTVALLDDDGAAAGPPLQMRPGLRVANLLWSQAFHGWKEGDPSLVDAPPAVGRRFVKLADGR